MLIVDDVPDNLAVLHDALDAAGYTVLVATEGASALQRAAQAEPDIVLLDAVMPGMDGFEVARRLKAGPETAHIPIVFMTGLTDTEHVLAAFDAGGVDYVTKPIRPPEVIARMGVHMQSRAPGAAGAQCAGRLRPRHHRRARWTKAACAWCGRRRWPGSGCRPISAPRPTRCRRCWWTGCARRAYGREVRAAGHRARIAPPGCTLQGRTVDDDWLVVLREVSDAATVEATMQALRLTLRESEVLYWVVKGKTNRDIGDILGSSPATVKKHLERVYEKLGVETRTAAAGVAMQRVPELRPA